MNPWSVLLYLSLSFCCNFFSYGQNSRPPKYISMAFIKSRSEDFLLMEKKEWVQVHQQLIKEGKKIAWYLYRVKYPGGSSAGYDYVRFDVFADWKQVEAPNGNAGATTQIVHPNLDVSDFTQKTAQCGEIVWEQLFEVVDEAFNKVNEPSKYIVVNQVKTVQGAESEYVKLERTYFKPFHAERVTIGIMNNWSLYRPMLPYGDKYAYNYVTMNGFSSWEDIIKNNPPGPWQKAHGNTNFNEIHDEILSKRVTINNELWELVAFAVAE